MADRKRRGRRKAQNRQHNSRQLLHHGALLAALTLLVALAFYMPQFIFQVQDGILCGDTILGERESVDVEALSTTYEKALGRRMLNFAEGQVADDSFYVTSQNLTPDEQLEEYLYSDKGIYQDFIALYVNYGLIPETIWADDYTVAQWKRYVIYSDNYAKGVNFILWYIELQDSQGVTCKFLVDAEDGSLYAVKTENNEMSVMLDGIIYDRNLLEDDRALTEIWGTFAIYYESLGQDEIVHLFETMEKIGWSGIDGILYDAPEDVSEIVGDADLHGILEGLAGYRRESDERVSFRLPYGGTYLEVVAQITEVTTEMSEYMYFYPDILIGIRQIYEFIPEFA